MHRGDPVFILGQVAGLFIYSRNLYFVMTERKANQAAAVGNLPQGAGSSHSR